MEETQLLRHSLKNGNSSLNLIGDAKKGCDDALGKVLETLRPYLLLIANQELPKELQAKFAPSDLVQESLLKAGRAFGGFRGTTTKEMRAWSRRILLNRLADVAQEYRLEISRRLDVEEILCKRGQPLLFSREQSPHDQLIQDEELKLLQDALDRLPESRRKLIQWRNFERLSFVEIGRRLDCSADAARKAWARTIEQIELPEMNDER